MSEPAAAHKTLSDDGWPPATPTTPGAAVLVRGASVGALAGAAGGPVLGCVGFVVAGLVSGSASALANSFASVVYLAVAIVPVAIVGALVGVFVGLAAAGGALAAVAISRRRGEVSGGRSLWSPLPLGAAIGGSWCSRSVNRPCSGLRF